MGVNLMGTPTNFRPCHAAWGQQVGPAIARRWYRGRTRERSRDRAHGREGFLRFLTISFRRIMERQCRLVKAQATPLVGRASFDVRICARWEKRFTHSNRF